METTKRTLIAIILAASSLLPIWPAHAGVTDDAYPGSLKVFEKYYPENEIRGMANDKAWRVVYISRDAQQEIITWYEQHFASLPVVTVDERGCYRKRWKLEGDHLLDLTVCDRTSYRTILLVIPGK